MRFALVLTILLLVWPAMAATLPQFAKGIAYSAARQRLLALGFAPVTVPNAARCARRGAADQRCYPELEACTGPQGDSCDYTWLRGQTIIAVHTSHLQPTVVALECVVNCRR